MKKILIVVDEIHILEMIEIELNSNEFEVISYRNATDAMGAFWKEDLAMIITDLEISGKTGFELIDEVRVDDQDVPIIALVSSALDEAELEKLGIDKQIKKPFSPRNVLEAVQKLLIA